MTQHTGEPLAAQVREALVSQYLAALEMLKQAILQCPDALWDDRSYRWIPLTKLELQLYNIRHLQLHTGELCERLGAAGVDMDWVGTRPSSAT